MLMDALFMKELLGKSGNLLQFKLVVFFFYLVYVIMPYVWHLFMQSYMGINRSKKQKICGNDSVHSPDSDGASLSSDGNCLEIFTEPDLYTRYIFSECLPYSICFITFIHLHRHSSFYS